MFKCSCLLLTLIKYYHDYIQLSKIFTYVRPWIQTHKAFLTKKKQIERFILYRAQPVPYRQYVVCSRYCILKQFIYKHKLL